MKRALFILMGVSAFLGGCVPGLKDSPENAHFQKGFKAYQDGDFQTALLYLKPLVENDHPGAQLLMARMYANAQGVPENMEKSEDLRNMAALRMYSKVHLKPGQVDPASNSLQVLEKRVDYYVSGAESGAPAPPQDSAALYAPDMDALAKTLSADAQPAKAQAPPTFSQSVQDSLSQAVAAVRPAQNPDFSRTRSTGQISLSNLLAEAALGKKESARQIARAYREGLYGMKPDPAEAAVWEKKQEAL